MTCFEADMSLLLQAGHFGQAPFDPLSQTNDYNRQAEVSGSCQRHTSSQAAIRSSPSSIAGFNVSLRRAVVCLGTPQMPFTSSSPGFCRNMSILSLLLCCNGNWICKADLQPNTVPNAPPRAQMNFIPSLHYRGGARCAR